MVKYLKTKQIGNKGEAYFESLISDYAIAHKIDSSKDVGLDFLCEWVHGEKPTQMLFGVQVKTRTNKRLSLIREECNLNHLKEFRSNLSIKEETLNYWRGFDFPIFLFLVNVKDTKLDCFYRRYTSILHQRLNQNEGSFYQVNNGNKFIAFRNKKGWPGGFCRDLFLDHLRCEHNKGMLSGVDPKDLGLTEHYIKDALYKGVFEDYKKQIQETFDKYKKFSKFFVK